MKVDPSDKWPEGAVGFDVAQICTNGHPVNPAFLKKPNRRRDVCPRCHAATIYRCPNCDMGIKGTLHGGVEPYVYVVPARCADCGQSYPWHREQRRRQSAPRRINV